MTHNHFVSNSTTSWPNGRRHQNTWSIFRVVLLTFSQTIFSKLIKTDHTQSCTLIGSNALRNAVLKLGVKMCCRIAVPQCRSVSEKGLVTFRENFAWTMLGKTLFQHLYHKLLYQQPSLNTRKDNLKTSNGQSHAHQHHHVLTRCPASANVSVEHEEKQAKHLFMNNTNVSCSCMQKIGHFRSNNTSEAHPSPNVLN